MKKSLVVILSMLLILGFSVSAFALHQSPETEYTPGVASNEGVKITLGGEIRVRGEYRDNTADFDSGNGDNRSTMDARVRLNLKAQTSKNTYGFIELESGEESWDETLRDYSTGDTWTWGGKPSGATGTYPRANYKPSGLWIRQAYIAHQGKGLLGRTAGFKVGHMLLGLGNGLFFDHTKNGDDALVLWADPADTEVSFSYVKFSEGTTTVNDDVNAYVLAVEAPLNNVNVSADITYIDDQDITATGVATDTSEGLHLWNIGLRGDTAINGINLRADVELQTGKAKLNYVNPVTTLREDRKFKGYAWLVGADTNVSDVTVGAEVAYGSGDKMTYDLTTPTGRSGAKNEAFQTSLGASQHYTYVYEYRAVSAAGATGTGLSNTWYINVGASKKVNPDLNVSADLYYLRASQAVTLGTTPARNADGTYKTSKNLGTEIDGKLEYQIDRNLVYFVEGGYLWAGAAYDKDDPTVAANGTNVGPDNAYAVRHGVVLKF